MSIFKKKKTTIPGQPKRAKSRYICTLPECVKDKIPCIKEDSGAEYKDSDCDFYLKLLKAGKTHKDCEYRVLRYRK